MKETIGICVLNWNAGSVLLSCVRQLQAARKGSRSHLVVVDNASSDDSVAALRSEIPGLAIIQNSANLGYAAGNNIGASFLLELGCDILLFVNPDVTLPAESLTRLVETLAADPKAGCAGGVPLKPSGEVAVVARSRPTALQKVILYGPLRRVPVFKWLRRGHWMLPEHVSDGATVYSVCGACLAFRADAFSQIGGFDDNTFIFEEEFIVAERLLAKGWSVIVATSAHYTHIDGLSYRRTPYRSRLHFYNSENYLLREYYGWHWATRVLLRVYRSIEWCASCFYWAFRSVKRMTRMRFTEHRTSTSFQIVNMPVAARRISLLTTTLAPGGAEVVVFQLAQALRSAGCEVSVVSMIDPQAFREELEAAGVRVVSLKMKPGRPNIGGVVRFLSYLREFQPNLIHGHMFHASILARLARVLTGVPVVCTIHNEIECSRKKTAAPFREWIYRVTDVACDRTTAVSERVRQRYVRDRIVPSHRIEVIDNGVDPERFRPCPERRQRTRTAQGWQDCFVWLAVGRLELAKDYPNLIEAFQKVRGQHPFSKLAIAGEGRLRPQIEHLIQGTGLQTAVSLLGSRTDVPDLMNACDAFVMPSAWEGAQLVLLEASATARPVVATEVGVAPQAVVPGQTGLLVPPKDPAALAQAMTRLMTVEARKLDQMGLNARRHIVDRFSLGSVHSRYMKLYEEVLTASA